RRSRPGRGGRRCACGNSSACAHRELRTPPTVATDILAVPPFVPLVPPAPPAMSPVETRLRDLLARRILILDGAMGTMIQRYRLDEAGYRGERFADLDQDVKGNNELLSLSQPAIVREIHEQFLAAGADIVETNTFGASAIAQADYRLSHLAREMNLASARLAREACDKYATPERPRFVAGAVGPQPKTASISPDVNDPGARNVTFDELREAYDEQVRALIEGGADLLLVETIFDTLKDRKSTRLNSSHVKNSYAVFCMKKINIYFHMI